MDTGALPLADLITLYWRAARLGPGEAPPDAPTVARDSAESFRAKTPLRKLETGRPNSVPSLPDNSTDRPAGPR